MAEPPYYAFKGKAYPPAPSSEPPQCNCHNNPVLTRQQCPRCINRPNTNIHWSPPSRPANTYPGNIGFQPSAPAYPSTFRPTPPQQSCTSCTSCSCTNHSQGCQPRPFINRPNPGPPRGGVKPYYWVDTFSHGGVPSTALHGGHDVDGAQIFVGRAFHEGDWIPAKVIPERNVAYIAYGGEEHAKHHYQVLCEQRFDWVPSSGGHVPPGAVEGGKTSDGESLFVGRVHHEGSLTVGKIHPSHGVCYIPFGGREIGHPSYEILVLRN